MIKVKLKTPKGEEIITAKPGELLSELILRAGYFIDRPCAGRGVCGKCKIRAEGELSPANEKEKNLLSGTELSAGFRLACQTQVLGEAEVSLPEETVITDKVFSQEYPVEQLKGPFGIALDLGTTTVGAFLSTLKDGTIYRGNAVLNQQAVYGAEVVSRLEQALKNKAKELKELAVLSIEQAVEGLGLNHSQLKEIQRMVVVGNSAMHHLLLGLSVQSLAQFPFEPVDKSAREIRTKLWENELEVWFPPLLGGFVGSDALACLLYLGFHTSKEPVSAIDLGTNGEVMVSDGKRILVASTAAGPAFEGVNIECGMRAVKGAVVRVKKEPGGGLSWEVIGGGEPEGLAGSGLLSLVALLRKEGVITPQGNLQAEGRKFFLTEKVYLSQRDVREVQKAKSAIRSAYEILLDQLGLLPEDIQKFTITGSFGARIDVNDLLELGVIPRMKLERIMSYPNSAGMGAGMMLHPEAFEFACQLAQEVEHIELNAYPSFMDKFVENMRLE